jgi:N-acetylglucosaminyl-diphospho-decaprenol L-rhamnosyltransferase
MTSEDPNRSRFVALHTHAELCAIVVTYNSEELITRCIDSLREACSGISVRVIIVDNASVDGTVDVVKGNCVDCILVENDVNVGFGRANNQVVSLCDSDFVLLLNPDAFVERDTITKTLAHMRTHPSCGILGVSLVGEEGQGGSSAYSFPNSWRDFVLRTGIRRMPRSANHSEVVYCDWVPGCFYMMRKQLLDQVGLFDPRYFLYFEEVDHCLAAKRAGWEVQCLKTTRVIHEGGASASSQGELNSAGLLSDLQIESELLFFRKHGGSIGALVAVLLGITADFILACKALLKGQPWSHAGKYWQNSRNVFRIARQSGLGFRPSR